MHFAHVKTSKATLVDVLGGAYIRLVIVRCTQNSGMRG